MQTFLTGIIAALLVTAALAGCGTLKEETAMEWLARQPVFTDDP